MKDNRNVIALAVGNTYDIVTRTSVTAHPTRAPYPRASYSLLIPIQKGGYMEEIYDVLSIVECPPQDVEKTKSPSLRRTLCAATKIPRAAQQNLRI